MAPLQRVSVAQCNHTTAGGRQKPLGTVPGAEKTKRGIPVTKPATGVDSDGGQETVTTIVNYGAPTTWWNPAKEKDAGIESGESSVVPQPEDA